MSSHFLMTAVLLGVSTCTLAESAVQLYGLIGAGLGGSKISPRNAASVSEGLKMIDDVDITSHWGILGSENLGNGTTVSFGFEAPFSPTTGATYTPYFGRGAWLAFGGDWGTLKVGRMFTVVDDTAYLFDLNGNTIPSAYTSAGLVPWLNYNSPIDHAGQLVYASPTLSGFEFRVAAVLKDDITDAAGDTTLLHGVGRARNLLQLGTSYERDKLLVGATLESKGGANNRLAYSAGARYDFQPLQASLTYNRMALKELGQGYTAGVAVPVGALRVGAQVGYNTAADVVALSDGTSKALELFATYNLSKRTALLANFNRTRYSVFGSQQMYGAGMRHAF